MVNLIKTFNLLELYTRQMFPKYYRSAEYSVYNLNTIRMVFINFDDVTGFYNDERMYAIRRGSTFIRINNITSSELSFSVDIVETFRGEKNFNIYVDGVRGPNTIFTLPYFFRVYLPLETSKKILKDITNFILFSIKNRLY